MYRYDYAKLSKMPIMILGPESSASSVGLHSVSEENETETK
jgi:hypothetical protein